MSVQMVALKGGEDVDKVWRNCHAGSRNLRQQNKESKSILKITQHVDARLCMCSDLTESPNSPETYLLPDECYCSVCLFVGV